MMALLTLGFALCIAPISGAIAQERKITLLIWSSTWNGLIKPLAEQFTKETGIGVDIEMQASSMEGLAKVQAMRGKPTADVWFVAAGRRPARRQTDPGLLAPMPVDQLSNWNDLIPGCTSPTFAAAYYFPFGIVYRPDLVPNGKITSWEELWGPGFENKLALPMPAVPSGAHDPRRLPPQRRQHRQRRSGPRQAAEPSRRTWPSGTAPTRRRARRWRKARWR